MTIDRIGDLASAALSAEARVARDRLHWLCAHAEGATLHLGCGRGAATILVAREGGRAIGVDASVDLVAQAAADAAQETGTVRARATFAAARVRRLPFPDASFDSVLAADVFERLLYPSEALAEVGRVLRPGGTLVVTARLGLTADPDQRRPLFPGSLVALLGDAFAPRTLDIVDGWMRLVAERGGGSDGRVLARALEALDPFARDLDRELGASSALRAETADAVAELDRAAADAEEEVAALRARALELEGELRRMKSGRWWRLGALVRTEAKRPWRLPLLVFRAVRTLRRSRGTTPAPATAPPTHVAARSATGSGRRSGAPQGESLLARGTEALRMLGGSRHRSDEPPAVLAYYPYVHNNPYQSMLYASCWERNIAPVPMISLEALDDVPALRGLGADVWFHIHWTGPILAKVETKRQAAREVEAFVERMDRLREAGGRIAWTIHNVLPHEHRYRDLEIEICRALADRADLIHVLCDRTPTFTEPLYHLPPEKVRVVPHPSYDGVYPSFLGKEDARFALGLGLDQTVFAVVGGIRRYKGIDGLLDAFDASQREHPDQRLIIAGRPINFPEIGAVRARCERNPAIISRFERIPEQDLQLYLSACDVVILPYEDILNSGVLMLALSFGRPVIAPQRGCVHDLVTPEIGITFDPGQPGALRDAIVRGEKLRDPSYGEAATAAAARFAPPDVARRFAEAMRSV